MCHSIRAAASLSMLSFALLLAPPSHGQVVVSQVYGGGGNSGAVLKADFVELFNRGLVDVNVDGWSVQYASASSSTWQASPLNGTVPAGSYYLVAMAAGSGGTVDLPTPDADGVSNLAAGAGKVALVRDTAPMQGACPGAAVIEDFVGYGSANCFEGQGAAPPGSNTDALLRGDSGCADSDDNTLDFETAMPAPRNGTDTPNDCATDASPTHSATATQTFTSTPSSSPILSPTPTSTTSPTVANTSTQAPTPTPSGSPSSTPTWSPTASPTQSATRTMSATPSRSPSSTATRSPTVSPTQSATRTVSATPSRSPSPTATRSPTASPSQSATRTMSATPSSTPTSDLPACGNGVIEVGEQCDDGNNDDGDLCPSSPLSRCTYWQGEALLQGNTRRRSVRRDGCQLEWYVAGSGLSPAGASTWTTKTCNDQNPGCDFDPVPGRCRFVLVACFNNTDPGLPECESRALSGVHIIRPADYFPLGTDEGVNRMVLDKALASLLDPSQPQLGHVHHLPLSADQKNFCTAPFALEVELSGRSPRAVNLRVDTFGAGERWPIRQRSRLRLVCVP